MSRRRRRAAVLVATALLVTILPAAPASSAPAVDARPSWSMVPQSKDANGDGFIDGDGGVPARGALSREPSPRIVGAGNRIAQPHERLIGGALSWYLDDGGFPVRLDACDSRGDEARWRVVSAGRTVLATDWRRLTDRRCARTVTLAEGTYDLTLEVRSDGRRDVETVPLEVRNVLVVSLGDSYASGEGNPRNVRSWLRQGGALTPYWDDGPCRRSVHAAPAQAALALERSSPRSSVTLVHLACSGATVDAGLLGPQTSAGQTASQIEQAVALLGGREADLVVLSIGGNDVGFTSILQACALSSDCPVIRPPAGPLAGYPTVQAGVQAQTAALAGDLDRVAACLGGQACVLADGRSVPALRLSSTARVLPSLYPDITRAADGQACSYLTIPTQDFAWARGTILDPAPATTYPYPLTRGGTATLSVAAGSLNGQLAAALRLPRWQPVTGTWSASGTGPLGHGVCADDEAWVFGFTGFTALPSASFHPNPTGQQALARELAQSAASVVDP